MISKFQESEIIFNTIDTESNTVRKSKIIFKYLNSEVIYLFKHKIKNQGTLSVNFGLCKITRNFNRITINFNKYSLTHSHYNI